MRSGKDDPLPLGMLILAACLYAYNHGPCGAQEHALCRGADLFPAFPMTVEFNKPDANRVFVTHGPIPPNVRKRLSGALEKTKANRQHADAGTRLSLAKD